MEGNTAGMLRGSASVRSCWKSTRANYRDSSRMRAAMDLVAKLMMGHVEEHVKLSDVEAQEGVSKNCRVVHHDRKICDQEALML